MSAGTPISDLKTIFDPATCVRKGLCPVTDVRSSKKDDNLQPLESHSLYFEQHGTGKEKVLFVMGLNSTSFGWAPQVIHFGRSPDHSVLVFDNRGVGNSDAPKGPYSTSAMAEDIIVLLDHVGWTEPRDLHVVGISLGGMIAQELAYRIPERIVSLTLTVTSPGGRLWDNLPSWKGVSSLARLIFIPQPVDKIPIILDMIYPRVWLEAKAEDDPQGRTNAQVQAEVYARRMEITRPQKMIGNLSQSCAGLTHYVSPARLAKIDKLVPKVTIVTGDVDYLVSPRGSRRLKAAMPRAELHEWKDTGHGVPGQHPVKFNEVLTRTFIEGRETLERGF